VVEKVEEVEGVEGVEEISLKTLQLPQLATPIACATFCPSIAALTIPPAYPAPSPQG